MTPTVARAICKVLLRRYSAWAREVQATDATDTLMKVDGSIDKAINAGSSLYVRQSDLSNCFTRLDPALVRDTAIAFGTSGKHAQMLFMINHHRPTVIKAAGYASDWKTTQRGVAQGDSQSPPWPPPSSPGPIEGASRQIARRSASSLPS